MTLPIIRKKPDLASYGLSPHAPEAIDSSMLKRKVDHIVARSERQGGCLIWLGGAGSHGYGMIYIDGGMKTVHSIICAFFHGPRPNGMDACHSCGNRRCVERTHLRWGSRLDNVKDAILHGTSRGIILDEADVEIIEACLRKCITKVAIAKAFGINRNAIYTAMRRFT
jgi:hypothetical protein